MNLDLEPYLAQVARWPVSGRRLLAQFDASTIVVYQAFRPSIAQYAVTRQFLGEGFSLARTSWIKPGFMWLMSRSGWGTKRDQESVLAIRVRRSFFDGLLRQAEHAVYDATAYGSRAEWQAALAASPVHVQWDPDHDPAGAKLARRVIQLGLRGEALGNYARVWIAQIEDVTDFVREQHRRILAGETAKLETPKEAEYPSPDEKTAKKLRIGEEVEKRKTHGGSST